MTQADRGHRSTASPSKTVAVLTLLAALAAPQTAWASESPEQAKTVREGAITFRERPVVPEGFVAKNLGPQWVPWERGERVFGMAGAGSSTKVGADHVTVLLSVDSRSGKELQRVVLPPTTDKYPSGVLTVNGADAQGKTLVVDNDGGRLFVMSAMPATGSTAAPWLSGLLRPPDPNNPVPAVPDTSQNEQLVRDRLVPADKGLITPICGFCRIEVRDAATLELQDTHYLSDRGLIDRLLVQPRLLAVRYEPAPEGGPQGGKLLVLAQESVHDNRLNSTASPARQIAALTYLIQVDAATGAQEWAVRIDACRSTNLATSDVESLGYEPVHATNPSGMVFRSRQHQAMIVGCHVSGGLTAGVITVPLDDEGFPAGLPVALGTDVDPGTPDPDSPPTPPVTASDPQQVVYGPGRVIQFIGDPGSGRVLLRTLDLKRQTDVWLVYDTNVKEWRGAIGMTPPDGDPVDSTVGFSSDLGRLYAMNGTHLYAVDIRRDPIPQALHFAIDVPTSASGGVRRPIVAIPASETQPALIWGSPDLPTNNWYSIFEDRVATAEEDEASTAPRSLDLDEADGITSSTFDGTARGYGARMLLVTGVEGALRQGPADAFGGHGVLYFQSKGQGDLASVYKRWGGVAPAVVDVAPQVEWGQSGCFDRNREAVLGFVGPDEAVTVDVGGSRGTAQPLLLDVSTNDDAKNPVSRCFDDWQSLWDVALFGSAPAGEPEFTVPQSKATCLTTNDESASERVGDATMQRFAAEASCEGDGATGYSYARGTDVEGAAIGEALSSFRVYRDPVRGMVSRVESVARGVSIDGVLRIATVRGVAESWANGRKQFVSDENQAENYDPNCDRERTAGTCFQRHAFGLWTPGYQCGPCGDERAFIDGLNRALGANGSATFRQPDATLAAGAADGSVAAVQKSVSDRFADLTINQDLLPTTVPVLEIIRKTYPNRPNAGGGNSGKQIIQLAGVEVATSYAISCLLEYDPEANTCQGVAEAPGSIQVSLSDTDGKPLAGGAFEVRADVDADGVLGLKDTLLPDGACVTAEDGIGTCVFENLQPGTYLVSQVAAPPGFAKSAEPWVSEVASGEQRTVAFTNVSNVSTIDLKATDENGAPLAGAVFAAYPDPDSDGKVAPDAQPAAECTTDSAGVCQMKVPAGSYVLVQTTAPGGLEGMEPVPFTFASGGQVASVSVVNYPPESPQAPEAAASPVYTLPVDQSPPREFIDPYVAPSVDVIEPDVAPGPSVSERVGGTVTQVIRAPGDALRLLARDPKQAVAWTAALALFCLAAMAVRRRQSAIALIRG